MKYGYGKIGKLAENLEKNNIDKEIIGRIMFDGDKIKQTDTNEKKSEWFYDAMARMDNELSESIRYKIRQACACCLGGKRNIVCKEINKKYTSVEEKIEAANNSKLVFGNGVKIISPGKYEVSFFPDEWEEKKCPCIKDLKKEMSLTYCYCCGGHVRYHLETVLGKKLRVKVLETALTTLSKKSCRFELTEE